MKKACLILMCALAVSCGAKKVSNKIKSQLERVITPQIRIETPTPKKQKGYACLLSTRVEKKSIFIYEKQDNPANSTLIIRELNTDGTVDDVLGLKFVGLNIMADFKVLSFDAGYTTEKVITFEEPRVERSYLHLLYTNVYLNEHFEGDMKLETYTRIDGQESRTEETFATITDCLEREATLSFVYN